MVNYKIRFGVTTHNLKTMSDASLISCIGGLDNILSRPYRPIDRKTVSYVLKIIKFREEKIRRDHGKN